VTFAAAKYAALFAEEAREQLAASAAALLALERAAADGAPAAGPVDAAFRAVHTVKGMSATMGYAVVERAAHELEHALARLREGSLAVSPPLVDALLGAADALERAVRAAVDGLAAPDVLDALATLAALTSVHAPPVDASPRSAAPTSAAGAGGYAVRVRIAPDAALPGVRAFMALQRAAALGQVADVHPPADALQSPSFDRTLAFRLVPTHDDVSPAAIANAVRGAGEIADVHVATPTEESPAVSVHASPVHASPVHAVPVPAVPVAAVPVAAVPRQVRVDAARIDALLDLAAELVTARGRLADAAARVGDAALAGAVADVGRLAGALHEQVLASRLVPVGDAFERMPRLVRDAARATGKRVALHAEGADVAVDRAVVDALAEPLGHLLRNAVDHGIEAPAARAAGGKPAAGRVTLRAARARDAVEVSVDDDGRGIDAARVLERAHAAGLVPRDVPALDDDRLLAVLANPGFSTAEQVTAVSGRGVGMDAVLARVRALGGTLALRTRAGEGTTWTLRLPLTLAVSRALLADAGDGATYALPLAHVRETLDLDDDARGGAGAVTLRGEAIPLIALRSALAAEPAADDDRGALAGCAEAAVVEVGGRRVALAVTAFGGQPDLVVKRLPEVRGALRIFGGATILESGAVALIVDVPALLSRIPPRLLP
jgi:two-component system chemotaxis sensor kinase CheA